MALLDLIKHRRSIRNFQDKPVEREKIMTCLEAARLAPSACNSQPWKFVVVDDGELKNKLCSAAFGSVYSINTFGKKAPVIVAVISDKSKFLARIGGMFRGTEYCLLDVGAAIEHFVLNVLGNLSVCLGDHQLVQLICQRLWSRSNLRRLQSAGQRLQYQVPMILFP